MARAICAYALSISRSLSMRLFSKPDFVLIHPPSVYDFRKSLVVPSPIADLIPSGPFFEMYPIGFSYLGEYLERHGFNVRVVNLATRMLEEPGLDVEKLMAGMRPTAFGIGLHWLPHCHGAVEVARLCKKLHPGTPVITGGYSASLFHRELMEYPEFDFVVRGDSTEEPLLRLLTVLTGNGDVSDIPNLTYRDAEGNTRENPLGYVPENLDHLGNNYAYMLRSAARYADIRGLRAFKGWWSYPLTAVLTCRGCSYSCAFCGGAAWSMERCFARRSVAYRAPDGIAADVKTISRFTGAPIFIIGDLRQGGEGFAGDTLDALGRVAPRNQVVLELFEPAPRRFFERVAASLPNFNFEISPESHDENVRRAAGKSYSNEELEHNIQWALEAGCGRFDVFFMIGLPHQTPASVRDTVSYCSRLLGSYGRRVNPLIGPLAPFLDPGSIFFEHAEKYGYRLLFHSLEDYREALLSPHWRDILSYETRWMSRQEIVEATYEAMLELNRIKLERVSISLGFAREMEDFLRENRALLERLDNLTNVCDPQSREAELSRIEKEAEALNRRASLVKEELKWPIEGRRFYLLGILRTIISGK